MNIRRNLGRALAVTACALALSGCVSRQERLAMDQNQCSGFGFEPGTDGFAQCMMGVSQQRETLAQSERIAVQNRNLAWFWENERQRALRSSQSR